MRLSANTSTTSTSAQPHASCCQSGYGEIPFMNMTSGNAAIGDEIPLVQNWLPNAVKSSGADSPATRATESSAPVTMPARATGTVTSSVDFQAGIPSASAPSRITPGTSRTASSVVRTTIGSMMTDSATAAEYAEK